MFKEFKEFAMRGNVLDLAVGVIIGVAFGGGRDIAWSTTSSCLRSGWQWAVSTSRITSSP